MLQIEINKNTTITEAITPCLSLVVMPLLSSVVLAPLCALSLALYVLVFRNRSPLCYTKLMYTKYVSFFCTNSFFVSIFCLQAFTVLNFLVSLSQLIVIFRLSTSDIRETYSNTWINFIFAVSFDLSSFEDCFIAFHIYRICIMRLWRIRQRCVLIFCVVCSDCVVDSRRNCRLWRGFRHAGNFLVKDLIEEGDLVERIFSIKIKHECLYFRN